MQSPCNQDLVSASLHCCAWASHVLMASCHFCQVTLWKESLDGQWACISDVNKGQGAVSSVTDGQQNEQWGGWGGVLNTTAMRSPNRHTQHLLRLMLSWNTFSGRCLTASRDILYKKNILPPQELKHTANRMWPQHLRKCAACSHWILFNI